MWVSMCFPRAVDSYFIVKKRPYSLAKIATRGVRPGYAVTTLLRHHSNIRRAMPMVGVSSVDLCTSFDVFGLLVYTINHRSLCTVGRGTGADPQRRAVLSWVYGRRKRQCVPCAAERGARGRARPLRRCTALSAPLTISEEVVLHSMELGERLASPSAS